jgi:hypothetical protein
MACASVPQELTPTNNPRYAVVSPVGKNDLEVCSFPISAKLGPYSCRTTLSRESLTRISPLYSMKPNFLNLFMKKLIRERVVPTISASISCDTLGSAFPRYIPSSWSRQRRSAQSNQKSPPHLLRTTPRARLQSRRRPGRSMQDCVKEDSQGSRKWLVLGWIVRKRDLAGIHGWVGLCLSSRRSSHWND